MPSSASKPAPDLVQTNETFSTNELSITNELGGSNDVVGVGDVAYPTNSPGHTNAGAPALKPQIGRGERDSFTRNAPNPTEREVSRPEGPDRRPVRPTPADRVPPTDSTASKPDFSSFRLIAERNIFDPNRSARHNPESQPKSKTIESFALVGIMSYEKGTFAFFDGSSSTYKKALKVGDTIAGYKLTDLTPDLVKLSAATNEVQLHVGSQLRREEEGEWTLAKASESYSYAATPVSNPTQTSASAGGNGSSAADNDILERLRKKREQE